MLRTIESQTPGTMFVVPSELLDALSELKEGRISEAFLTILKSWLGPPISDDHVEEIALGLSVDSMYLATLSDVLNKTNLVRSADITNNMERIGTQTIRRKDVTDLFGDVAGRIVFELFAAAYKVGTAIVAFGDRLVWIAQRAGLKVHYAKSKLKRELRNHSEVKQALRLMGIVMSLDEIKAIALTLGIPPEVKDHIATIGVGLVLIANG